MKSSSLVQYFQEFVLLHILDTCGKKYSFSDQTEIHFKLNSKRQCQKYVYIQYVYVIMSIPYECVLLLCHQLATSKGFISGDLCYMEEDGTRIDCHSSSAVSSLNNLNQLPHWLKQSSC